MEHKTIFTEIDVYKYEELTDEEKFLVDSAREATSNSYSPYSRFAVGAAIRLEDGTVIKGANQENAAFPVTMCAERSAIFNAQSNFPQLAITHLAVCAKNANGFMQNPVSLCGSCRQAILEMEHRYKRKIRIYLCGESCIYVLNGIENLLPLSFVDESMH